MPARAYRHAIGGLSVTGNLSDFRKVIRPTFPILFGRIAMIGDIMLSNLLDCPQIPVFTGSTLHR